MELLNSNLLQSIPMPMEIQGNALELSGRAEKLRKVGVRYAIAAGICAVLGIAGYALALWATPSVAISSAHIPDQVLNLFEQGGTLGVTSFMVSTIKVMSTIGILVSVAIAFVTRNFNAIVGAIFCMTLSLGGISLFESLGISPKNSITTASFGNLVNTGNFPGVHRELNQKGVNGSVKDYVLAQSMLIRKEQEASNAKLEKVFNEREYQALVSNIDHLPQNIAQTFSPEIMYALETQAFGQAHSQIATQYEKNAKSAIRNYEQLCSVMNILSWVFISIAAFLFAIKFIICNRLERIGVLLGGIAQNPKQNGLPKPFAPALLPQDISSILKPGTYINFRKIAKKFER